MTFRQLIAQAERTLRDNSPAILTALGVSGTISTAYLTGKATFRAASVLAHENELTYTHGAPELTRKEAVKAVWKLYIPAAVSGALTIGCIVSSTRIGMKRTAAAYSLMTISEQAFVEYKEKVVEQIGEKKEKAIHDQIAQDRMDKDPVSKEVVIVGNGSVLCYEMHTGRYFNSDIETLRRAQNNINAKLMRENEATLSDFYYMVGLPYTSYSSFMGWDVDKQMELSFSTVMSEDNRPCIAFEYNYVKQF